MEHLGATCSTRASNVFRSIAQMRQRLHEGWQFVIDPGMFSVGTVNMRFPHGLMKRDATHLPNFRAQVLTHKQIPVRLQHN